ncbi:MAG: hypothetical protein K2K98_12155 [Muribaculaceae bacterium]|nr:hypothetical protein [Muribaculaceae bacterium]
MGKFPFILSIIILFSQVAVSAENYVPDTKRIIYWCELGEKLSKGESLENYISSLDSLDIFFTPPKNFKLIARTNEKSGVIFSPNLKYRSQYYDGIVGASLIGPAFESSSRDALILYPVAIDAFGISPDYLVESELISALSNDSINISSLIKISSNSEINNADHVIVYEFETSESQWNDYKHCVGLALRKKNHFAFPIKILLNDKGLQEKEKYIDIALKSINFGSNPKNEWIELEKKVRDDEGVFPMKKSPRCTHNN